MILKFRSQLVSNPEAFNELVVHTSEYVREITADENAQVSGVTKSLILIFRDGKEHKYPVSRGLGDWDECYVMNNQGDTVEKIGTFDERSLASG